jgi:hypothetical protein
MEKCCDACGDEEYYLRSDFPASEGDSVSEASNAVDRKSMGHTVADRSWNEADFLCIFLLFLCLAWRLWKSVVTLPVTENTISGRIFGVRGCRCFRGIDAVDRKSMGHTVADRSSNEADFICISCI